MTPQSSAFPIHFTPNNNHQIINQLKQRNRCIFSYLKIIDGWPSIQTKIAPSITPRVIALETAKNTLGMKHATMTNNSHRHTAIAIPPC